MTNREKAAIEKNRRALAAARQELAAANLAVVEACQEYERRFPAYATIARTRPEARALRARGEELIAAAQSASERLAVLEYTLHLR